MISSLSLVLFISLILATWAHAIIRARRGAEVESRIIWRAALIPPLLITAVLLSGLHRFGDYRIALEGVRFRCEPGGASVVRVGGSVKDDHVVVGGLPPGFLTFQLSPNEATAYVDGNASQRSGDDRLHSAVVRIGSSDNPFHNSVELREGAQVFIDGTPGPIVFSERSGSFRSPTTSYPQIPPRRVDVRVAKLSIGRQLPPQVAIHPLRDYAAHPAGVLDLPGGAPVGSFVYRGGGFFRGGYFLALTEPGVRVEQPGMAPAAFQNRIAELTNGRSQWFSLSKVDYRTPDPERLIQGGRVQELRSFRARFSDGKLDLVFDTPTFVRLERSDVERLVEESPDHSWVLSLVSRRFDSPEAKGRMLLEFSALGDPVASELFSRIKQIDSKLLGVTTHLGARQYRIGDAFEIGDRAAAIVRISNLGFPPGLPVLVWMSSLAAVAFGLLLRRSAIPFILISGTELFLALRVLLAYQASVLDQATAEAAWQSVCAYAAVPFVLQGAMGLWPGYRGWITKKAYLVYGAFTVMVLIVVLAKAGAGARATILAVSLVLMLVPICGLLLPRGMRILLSETTATRHLPFRSALFLAGVLVLLRLAAVFGLGWKERVEFGSAMAVSVFYTPAVLLVFAMLWRDWHAGRRRVVAFYGLLIIFYLVIPLIVSDWGTLLIFSLPAMMLLAVPLELERSRKANWFAALPLLFVITTHVLLILFSGHRMFAGLKIPDLQSARADPSVARELIETRTQANRDKLRFWSRVAPDVLKQVGTTDSESMAIVFENLDAYAARGAFGVGYLGVPISAPLRATHLDDNLSSVHILATFGWAGATAILALLMAWACAPALVFVREQGMDSLTAERAFGLMLVWTLAVAGFYMFSANVNLLLFTGKNVYFLAAASLSDVVEGSALVLLALFSFRTASQPGPVRPESSSPVMEGDLVLVNKGE